MEEKENELPKAEEQTTEDEVKAIIESAKKDFEKRLADTTSTLSAKIAERDKIIADLISGKEKEEKQESFIEKLNKIREENKKFI